MKERIEKKVDEKIEYILNKSVEEITSDEIGILNSKLFKIEQDETKEERNKDMMELLAKTFKY